MVIISGSNENTGFKIKSVQACSIVEANNGYSYKFGVDGDIRTSKLDIGDAVINNSLFSEYLKQKKLIDVSKKNVSFDFVNIKFDYGINVGVNTEKDSNSDGSKNKKKIVVDENGNAVAPMSYTELRKQFYKDGVTIHWKIYDKDGNEIPDKEKIITYRMLMRNPGKAKEGECIFVKESIYKKVLNFLTMDLWDKMPEENAKIVEMSAYCTLITGTAIDFITIPMKNIFVLEDETVTVSKKALTVKVDKVKHDKETEVNDFEAFDKIVNQQNLTFYKKKASENPELTYIGRTAAELKKHGIELSSCPKKKRNISYTREECVVDRSDEKQEIPNVLWDGMGLIDDSIFPADMEGFIYCRSHFFKSCLFRGSIQQYFKDFYGADYDTAYATDMFGRKMKVKDIKVIVTNNSLKWLKFQEMMNKIGDKKYTPFRYYCKKMQENGNRFAILKTAHRSKFGDMQKSSYQINNTLLSTEWSVLREIAAESIRYCDNLKLDDEAFLKHLKFTGSAKYSINNVLIDLYRQNDYFRNTEYFIDKRDKIISRFKNEKLMLGKLLQYGDNLTICGNPIAMLMKVTGQDFMKEDCFKSLDDRIQCYTERFAEGEMIAGFRSPHNSPNNIVYLENVYPAQIRKYFSKLGKNIVIINGIETDVQSRLSGQDLDTDFVYATNQRKIAKLAKIAYKDHLTIINGIKEVPSTKYSKDMDSYASMDSNIAASQYTIGEASNVAQLALSYYMESDNTEDKRKLEDVYVICSVLAQVAIDSAKRSFEIDPEKELCRIRKLDCMNPDKKYPVFYAKVQKLKNKNGKNKEIKSSETKYYNCPMDILYQIIRDEVIDLRKYPQLQKKKISFNKVFEFDCNKTKVDRHQAKKVTEAVNAFNSNTSDLSSEDEDFDEKMMLHFDECMQKLNGITIKHDTMMNLIEKSRKNSKVFDKMLIVLYDKDRDEFLKCFKKVTKNTQKVSESVAS